jgi:hypothetical protein
MTQSNLEPRSARVNRFEKHRAVTLVIVLSLLSAGLLALFEITLAWFESAERPRRHLVLSEYPPGQEFRFRPPAIRVTHTDEQIEPVYVLKLDKNGFIEPSVIHNKPDLEIVFLGGSTTECLYVKAQDRFPYVVGRLLEEQTRLKINSLNAGKSGNNVMHSNLVFLGKVVSRHPQFAVLMHGVNDLALLRTHGSYWTDASIYRLIYPGKEGITEAIRMARDALVPRTYRYVRQALLGVRGHANIGAAPRPVNKQAFYRVEQAAVEFEKALRTFVRTAQIWGIQPILMTEVVQAGKENGQSSLIEGDYLSLEHLRHAGFDQGEHISAQAYFNSIIRHVAIT